MSPTLRRLSPGPTIPDLLQAELTAWCAPKWRTLLSAAWPPPIPATTICLTAAMLALTTTRTLLRLRLITPECAATAFKLAIMLTEEALGSRKAQKKPVLF